MPAGASLFFMFFFTFLVLDFEFVLDKRIYFIRILTDEVERKHNEGNYDYPNHYVKQQYLPDSLVGTEFYHPSDNGYEKQIKEYMRFLKENE